MLQKSNFYEIKILTIVIFLAIGTFLGVDIHLASMPHIMRFMDTNEHYMQLSVSLFLLGLGTSILIYGPLSDKHGRKPIIIIGLAIAVIASIGAALSKTIEVFLFMRILQGIGSGVCIGLGRVIVADISKGKRLAVLGSYVSLFQSLSPIFAPVIGAFIQNKYNWQMNFIFLAAYYLLVLIIYFVACEETNKYKNPIAAKIKHLYSNYKDLLKNPVFLGSSILSGCALSAFVSFSTLSAFIIQIDFKIDTVQYGLIISLLGFISIIYKSFFGMILNLFGSKKTILIGISLLFVSGIWLLIINYFNLANITTLIIGVAICFLGCPLIAFNTLSLALTPFGKKMGSAGALYGSLQILISFVASSTVASIALKSNILTLAIAYIILSIICIYSFYFFLSTTCFKE